jgi:sulfate transport system permease protein
MSTTAPSSRRDGGLKTSSPHQGDLPSPSLPPHQGKVRKARRVLPGFGLTLGFSLFYLSLMVFVPLSALFVKTAGLSWADFVTAVAAPRVLATYRVTFGSAFIAALINLVFGLLIAWVLVRYKFPGKRIVDALVDLPFALPTAVAGIALTAILSNNGWLGQYLQLVNIHLAYNPAGIVVALTFISLPFVVRTVQPVLEDSEAELEEAAASLGATRLQVFTKVILPAISPALLTGFAMAFARAIGEYGSVVFIAGNMPMVSEITPLLIMVKLEQFDYAGASAVAVVLMIASFLLLLLINGLQAWQRRQRSGASA